MATAQNLLKQLTKNAPKSKTTQPSRATTELQDEQAESLRRWAGAAILTELTESRKSNEHDLLRGQLLDEFAEHLFNQGYVPENPLLQLSRAGQPDVQANFQVQNSFKFNADSSENLLKNLQEVLGEENGLKLFESEIDSTPKTSLRPFNELAYGHYQAKEWVEATETEQNVAQKLLSFVMGKKSLPLTEEEKELVLRHEDQMKVKPGFLARVKQYVDSVSQLKALLMVIAPKHFLSHAKFGLGDSVEQRNARLVDEMADILGRDLALAA